VTRETADDVPDASNLTEASELAPRYSELLHTEILQNE
jgi:hypothetical protein